MEDREFSLFHFRFHFEPKAQMILSACAGNLCDEVR